MRLVDKACLFGATRELVAGILRHPFEGGRQWSYQGLGMVRTTLDAENMFRLNVWHRDLRIENISAVHTHPWDLKSYVMNGVLGNLRYLRDVTSGGPNYDLSASLSDETTCWPATGMKLGCGANPNGSMLGEPFDIMLYPQKLEVYNTGEVYTQERDEIHKSRFENGTVSLNVRTNKRDDSSATVFWPRGTEWVDAKQSYPSHGQVRDACAAAIDCWEE